MHTHSFVAFSITTRMPSPLSFSTVIASHLCLINSKLIKFFQTFFSSADKVPPVHFYPFINLFLTETFISKQQYACFSFMNLINLLFSRIFSFAFDDFPSVWISLRMIWCGQADHVSQSEIFRVSFSLPEEISSV